MPCTASTSSCQAVKFWHLCSIQSACNSISLPSRPLYPVPSSMLSTAAGPPTLPCTTSTSSCWHPAPPPPVPLTRRAHSRCLTRRHEVQQIMHARQPLTGYWLMAAVTAMASLLWQCMGMSRADNPACGGWDNAMAHGPRAKGLTMAHYLHAGCANTCRASAQAAEALPLPLPLGSLYVQLPSCCCTAAQCIVHLLNLPVLSFSCRCCHSPCCLLCLQASPTWPQSSWMAASWRAGPPLSISLPSWCWSCCCALISASEVAPDTWVQIRESMVQVRHSLAAPGKAAGATSGEGGRGGQARGSAAEDATPGGRGEGGGGGTAALEDPPQGGRRRATAERATWPGGGGGG